jgi:hypothetical protein
LAVGRDEEVKTARIAGVETRARKAEWFAAMRWRRRVEATLREVKVTFTQWLVLSAAQELIEERRDAVSQKEIAARLESSAGARRSDDLSGHAPADAQGSCEHRYRHVRESDAGFPERPQRAHPSRIPPRRGSRLSGVDPELRCIHTEPTRMLQIDFSGPQPPARKSAAKSARSTTKKLNREPLDPRGLDF